jgi:hypothetical protein
VVEYSASPQYCPSFGGLVATTCSSVGTTLYLSGNKYGSSDSTATPPTDPACSRPSFYYAVNQDGACVFDAVTNTYKRTVCSDLGTSTAVIALTPAGSGFLTKLGCGPRAGDDAYLFGPLGCSYEHKLGVYSQVVSGMSVNGSTTYLFTATYGQLDYTCSSEPVSISILGPQDVCSPAEDVVYTIVSAVPSTNSSFIRRSTYNGPGCLIETLTQEEHISIEAANACVYDSSLGYRRIVACSQGAFEVVFTGRAYGNDSTCAGNHTSEAVAHSESARCQYDLSTQTSSKLECTMPYVEGTPTIAPAPFPTGVPSALPTSSPSYGPCAHSVCLTGVPLHSTCHPCAAQVITRDYYCGAAHWDGVCVYEVYVVCGIECSDASPAWQPVPAPQPIKRGPSPALYPTSVLYPSPALYPTPFLYPSSVMYPAPVAVPTPSPTSYIPYETQQSK